MLEAILRLLIISITKLDLKACFQEIIYIPRIKDRAYEKIFGDKKSKGTHWVPLFMGRNAAIYIDSFGIEYIPQEVLSKVRDKSITSSIFRIQDN